MRAWRRTSKRHTQFIASRSEHTHERPRQLDVLPICNHSDGHRPKADTLLQSSFLWTLPRARIAFPTLTLTTQGQDVAQRLDFRARARMNTHDLNTHALRSPLSPAFLHARKDSVRHHGRESTPARNSTFFSHCAGAPEQSTRTNESERSCQALVQIRCCKVRPRALHDQREASRTYASRRCCAVIIPSDLGRSIPWTGSCQPPDRQTAKSMTPLGQSLSLKWRPRANSRPSIQKRRHVPNHEHSSCCCFSPRPDTASESANITTTSGYGHKEHQQTEHVSSISSFSMAAIKKGQAHSNRKQGWRPARTVHKKQRRTSLSSSTQLPHGGAGRRIPLDCRSGPTDNSTLSADLGCFRLRRPTAEQLCRLESLVSLTVPGTTVRGRAKETWTAEQDHAPTTTCKYIHQEQGHAPREYHSTPTEPNVKTGGRTRPVGFRQVPPRAHKRTGKAEANAKRGTRQGRLRNNLDLRNQALPNAQRKTFAELTQRTSASRTHVWISPMRSVWSCLNQTVRYHQEVGP